VTDQNQQMDHGRDDSEYKYLNNNYIDRDVQ